jgi:hypothetical protein
MAKKSASDDKCCVYCGDWYECRDHPVPVSYSDVYRTYRRGETVPACVMCNNLLGAHIFSSMNDRSEFLLGRYERRFAKIMRFPEWASSEIDDLDWGLRCLILMKMHAKLIAKSKISNLVVTSMGGTAVRMAHTKSHEEAAKFLLDLK